MKEECQAVLNSLLLKWDSASLWKDLGWKCLDMWQMSPLKSNERKQKYNSRKCQTMRKCEWGLAFLVIWVGETLRNLYVICREIPENGLCAVILDKCLSFLTLVLTEKISTMADWAEVDWSPLNKLVPLANVFGTVF